MLSNFILVAFLVDGLLLWALPFCRSTTRYGVDVLQFRVARVPCARTVMGQTAWFLGSVGAYTHASHMRGSWGLFKICS